MKQLYSASLIFRSQHELESIPTALFEEQIVLLRAADDSEARELADKIGLESQHEFEVADPVPHTVRWCFVRTLSVYRILDESLDHGSEVFSRLISATEAHVLLNPPAVE